MTEEQRGHPSPVPDEHRAVDHDDAPEHPEPDPRLRGFPPPVNPSPAAGAAPYPSGPAPYPVPGHAPHPEPGSTAPAHPVPGAVPVPQPAPAYPPVPYGAPPVLARPPALPTTPARYSQLLRGPRHRWWKPLLSLLLGGALLLGFSVVAVVPPLVVGLLTGVPDLARYIFTAITDVEHLGPVGFVALNLSLIILIPTAMLSIWVVHGVRPRFVSSVTGGIRWRWMARCLLVVVPVWVVYVGFTLVADPPAGARPEHWVALLVIVVLMTPLQAAGEEYLFRGWILQNVGAWFARPVVGLVVATVISTVLFSAAHGSPDIWILGSIGCLAVASCLATWRTGGLEAGIAMHAVNNILAFFVTIVFGGWQNAFIGSDTKGTVVQFVLSVLVHGVALALIWWQAARQDLPYLSRPSVTAAPAQLEGAPAGR